MLDAARPAMLLALSCVLPACGGAPPVKTAPTGHAAVEVRLATRGKKIYPLYTRNARYWITDLKLPLLLVTNRDVGPLTIQDVVIEGFEEGSERPAVTRLIPGADLAREQAATTTALKKLLASGAVPAASLRVALGELVVRPDELGTGEILPGRSALLPLPKLAHLQHVGTRRLSRLRLVAQLRGPRVLAEIPLMVPLMTRQPAAYTFPLRGQVTLANLAITFGHHRSAHSQEFGLDIISTQLQDGEQVSSAPAGSKQLGDYFIYGREVLAIADGVVVGLADRFPEERSIPPTTYSPAAMAALMKLASEIGFLNALAGNHLTVDHGNGEHSVYAHLQQGSIRPRLGDRVRQGEVIGKVGGTGNSSEPHLHFQLQDGKDFLTANGLPVIFGNARPKDSAFGIEANGYWGTTIVPLMVK